MINIALHIPLCIYSLINTIKTWSHIEEKMALTPKALQWPNFGHCCFGQVLVRRRCDMIFWEFYGM
jgi:hypothetical protein